MAVSNTSHHILHRMVPLICQALISAPTDEGVWLEGLEMLCDPKLHTSMTLTSSIWLPLLLRGLEAWRPRRVILASLKLLGEMNATLEPMKSSLVKPLRSLSKSTEVGFEVAEQLKATLNQIGLVISAIDRNLSRSSSVSEHCSHA